MWNPPGPGIKPMSPALEGGFLTTGPTRKSCMICFMYPGIYFIIPLLLGYFFVVQSLSSIWLSHPMDCSTPGFPVLHHLSLVKLLSIELVMPSKYLVLFFPRLLLPSVFPSIRVFSNESVLCIRWPKFWSFSFSISPVNIQGWFPLRLTGLIYLLSEGLLRIFSRTTVQKHQFFDTQPSLLSNSYIHTRLLEKP